MRENQQLLEAQIVEHGVKSLILSKIHMFDLKKKTFLLIKASAKCINVYTFRVSGVVCIEKSKE